MSSGRGRNLSKTFATKRERYRRNHDVGPDRKRCRLCTRVQALEAFYQNKTGAKGREARCIDCMKQAWENRPADKVVEARRRAREYKRRKRNIPPTRWRVSDGPVQMRLSVEDALQSKLGFMSSGGLGKVWK